MEQNLLTESISNMPSIPQVQLPKVDASMFTGTITEVADQLLGAASTIIDTVVAPLDAVYGTIDGMFQRCYKLKSIPNNILENCSRGNSPYYNQFYYNAFYQCYNLKEILNLDVSVGYSSTSNLFFYTVNDCYSLRRFTFKTNEDGTPIDAQWNGQILDFSQYTGWASSYTAQQWIDEDYVLKPEEAYYNRDSMAETINSLPKVKNCTIKFKKAQGQLLTEDEIALANSKGWTVSLVN